MKKMNTLKALAVGSIMAAAFSSAPTFAADAETSAVDPAAWRGWGYCRYFNRTEYASYSWCWHTAVGNWVYAYDNLIEQTFIDAAASKHLINVNTSGSKVVHVQLYYN